ncbi:MAG: calcium/sodium antiporter [Anaerolineae bacterium]|nr:calcium/sodium antiporter [Anaerolineae bacterium]
MDLATLVFFIAGFVILVFGAELLVRGAAQLAVAVGISPLVIGLTVVAYGTSSPELAVSLQSSYAGQADIAIGNVVGSNIANVLLILGVSALITPLMVAQQMIRLDVPIMIGLSVLLLVMGLDGGIGRIDGLILFAGAIVYTVFVIRQSRKENKAVQQEYEQQFGSSPVKLGVGRIAIDLGRIGAGLALLVLGANWLVEGAIAAARFFGVSELVIGLTVVAVGTSLPEVATSVTASLRGERDIAVGNIIGSNIFNIVTVLGLTGLVTSSGVNVSMAALHFDIPVMIAVAVACLPIFFTGSQISQWEGFMFLGYYVAYTLYLLLNATDHQSLPAFNTIMLIFVLPLTVITLLISLMRSLPLNFRKT